MGAETRERILESSAELFRRQGYVGTGVKQIVAEAGAPFGSLYHFFPGGKEELGAETIRRAGRLYGLLLGEYAGPDVELVHGHNFLQKPSPPDTIQETIRTILDETSHTLSGR